MSRRSVNFYVNMCKTIFGLVDDDLAFVVTHIFTLISAPCLAWGFISCPRLAPVGAGIAVFLIVI